MSACEKHSMHVSCCVWCAHFRQKNRAIKSEIEKQPIRMWLMQKSVFMLFMLFFFTFSRSHKPTERQTTVVEKKRTAHANISKLPINARIQNAFSFYMCNLCLHAIIESIKLEKENYGKWDVIVALSAKHKHAHNRCDAWLE